MQLRRMLVPLAVLAFVVGLYFWPGRGDDPRHDFGADAAKCAANLRALYAGLILYNLESGHPPQGSGVAFFAELVTSGRVELTPESRSLFTCPGRGAAPVPDGTDYHDLASLSAASSAYAGRNTAQFPLAKFPSGGPEIEPLIACDNAQGMNHAGVMNVLYSDGSIVTLVLAQEIERGHLPPGATTIPVGKDSPIEDLRKLVGD